MTRIWLNHWFSTAYNIVSLINSAFPDIEIIGSNGIVSLNSKEKTMYHFVLIFVKSMMSIFFFLEERLFQSANIKMIFRKRVLE